MAARSNWRTTSPACAWCCSCRPGAKLLSMGGASRPDQSKTGVTPFYERIAELPAIFDEARGADILDTLTKALGASPTSLLLPPELLQDDLPKFARCSRRFFRRPLSCGPRAARPRPSRRLPVARSRRLLEQAGTELAAAVGAARRRKRPWLRFAATSGGSRFSWASPISAASGDGRCGQRHE